ncbi:uncharacterized protein HMPREF1541_04889 [Cyphellophora europaea CBS 101466]|uniref:Uncharacterized protein n=1 Tax=Cyphellophora europaea (strain CBS 101466) TaxID=1220924 RepID=W2RVY1_CYPE1|nr:uncharacterized protein HMPREF1541_04889 [Cyphellophora europaea CBS 101466]ETN40612.1 hypothetical protein HMPREF1541_04889 [Cyphellophora europaea CBS 101466]
MNARFNARYLRHSGGLNVQVRDNPYYPGRAKMDSWLEVVPKDTLRWHVTTRPSASVLKKTVQRNALQSKWYKLFCQALWDHGYTREGRKQNTWEKGLAGTLELIVIKGAGWDESEEVVLGQCSKIVAAVEAEQRKTG